jgi:SAM-dependent methyltransferase
MISRALQRAGAAMLYITFGCLFLLLSPIYYLNRWDFRRHSRRNPFYTAKLVRLQERYPVLYELAMYVQNFPIPHHVYKVLPRLQGDVLQVGCGTGLLNRFLGHPPGVRFINMDSNLHALRVGVRLNRYESYIHARIDRRTPLEDASFDTVLFARSFHHVRDHKKAFEECARLLRPGGSVIIADPVMLKEPRAARARDGYMANSSIDGLIWRFTRETLVEHLHGCMPDPLYLFSVHCIRQLHVTNYNLFVPQTDVIAILRKKRSAELAGENHQPHRADEGRSDGAAQTHGNLPPGRRSGTRFTAAHQPGATDREGARSGHRFRSLPHRALELVGSLHRVRGESEAAVTANGPV